MKKISLTILFGVFFAGIACVLPAQESQERSTDDALRMKLAGVWLTNEQWHNSLVSPTGTITLGTNGSYTQVVTETVTYGAAKGTQETVTYRGSWHVEDGYLMTGITEVQSKSLGEQPMAVPAAWRGKIIRVSDRELVCVTQINNTEPSAASTWKRSK
jgi:hypothetical protein